MVEPASCVCVQEPDVFKYHVILNELLFPDHLADGTLKSTLLGRDYQVQFHLNDNNQVTAAGRSCDQTTEDVSVFGLISLRAPLPFS